MASALVGGRPIVERVAFTTRRDIASAARICGLREWKREDNKVEEVAYRSVFLPTINGPYDKDLDRGNCKSNSHPHPDSIQR